MKTQELNVHEMQAVNGGIIGGLFGGDKSMLNITNGLQLSYTQQDRDGDAQQFVLSDVFSLNLVSLD